MEEIQNTNFKGLDEAIAHYENTDKQLAKWLKELKTYRECNVCEHNKVIDDFADRLSENLDVKNATKYGNKNATQQKKSYDTLMKYEIADAINDVTEQLKIHSLENIQS